MKFEIDQKKISVSENEGTISFVSQGGKTLSTVEKNSASDHGRKPKM
jgi:hypothetical protein